MLLSDDPWAWPDMTSEQLIELSGMSAERGNGPDAPVFQYFAVRKCLELRAAVEAGDGFSTLEAVYICGNAGLKMPLWLSYAFNRKYMAVVRFQAISWDDPKSFGRPYPKGTNRNARAKKKQLGIMVYRAVNDTLKTQPDTPIDKALFEEIGRKFGTGATLTEEYYYDTRKMFDAPMPFDVLLQPFVVPGINPAKNRKSAGLRKRSR